MKVFIRESAEEDLDRIFAWIAKDNPRAATELLKRIQDKVNRLEIDSLVHMGRKAWWKAPENSSSILILSFTKLMILPAKSRCWRLFMARAIADLS
jgi:hypothetical protein